MLGLINLFRPTGQGAIGGLNGFGKNTMHM
jgi:hypothetical protein